MKRVWITGDIHGDIDIVKLKSWKKENKETLDRDDILIVCGDMGICWDGGAYDRYIKKIWEQKPYTILFVDGNHENFPVLNSFPWQDSPWGAPVQQIAQNVFRLKRGAVYNIYGKTFFAFGGASSHDKWCRKEGRDWWPEELPTMAECDYALECLEAAANKVDFIVSHCTDNQTMALISNHYEHDIATNFLTHIKTFITYDIHYFGHYHIDRAITPQDIALYYSIIQII